MTGKEIIYFPKKDRALDIKEGKTKDGPCDIHLYMSIYCQPLGEKPSGLSYRRKKSNVNKSTTNPWETIMCVLKTIKSRYLRESTVSL